MSRIPHKKLVGLPVVDTIGTSIGVVVGFDIDTETQSIHTYYVNPHKVVRMVSPDITIHSSQVVSISDTGMVVEDTSIQLADKKTASSAVSVM